VDDFVFSVSRITPDYECPATRKLRSRSSIGEKSRLRSLTDPAQGFLSVGEGTHLDYLAITHCIDIRQLHILPLITTFGSNLTNPTDFAPG
jgi:hypothetical protein